MADFSSNLGLMRGLGAASMVGADRPTPGRVLPGMIQRMPPEQLARWRELMRLRMAQQLPHANVGMGFTAPLPTGETRLAPLAALARQNPLLLQMLMGGR